MANPSRKAPAIDSFITNVFGFDRQETIHENVCVPAPIGCGKPVDLSEMSEIEQKEYRISGLCKTCQREIFGW